MKTFKQKIRQAVADYVISEGCSCSRSEDSRKAAQKVLAKLLDVPKYKDGSGYNFYKLKSDITLGCVVIEKSLNCKEARESVKEEEKIKQKEEEEIKQKEEEEIKQKEEEEIKHHCKFCGNTDWWYKNDWGYVDLDEQIYVCRPCNKIAHKIYDVKP